MAERAQEPGVYRLPSDGRLLRVRGARRPTEPELYADGAWHRLTHTELVKLTAEELRRCTGLSSSELPTEMTDSRDAVAALLTARARTTPPDDLYLRSEQSLITGHPYHPAPKARGGGPVTGWLPYAPEAYARFPLELLAVREDAVVEEGDTTALDVFGEAPPGYRLLPAHPWQLDLVGARPEILDAFADGRLVRLGRTARPLWPTAAIRTLYAPDDDLFVKFSLDVRITNDIRRLWRHDLLKMRRTDAVTASAFAASRAPAAWLSDRGYRTADFAFEELAVLVRDGLRGHLVPGATRSSRPPSWRASTAAPSTLSPTRPPGGRRICARSCPRCWRRSTATESSSRHMCRTRWWRSTPTACPYRPCSGTRKA